MPLLQPSPLTCRVNKKEEKEMTKTEKKKKTVSSSEGQAPVSEGEVSGASDTGKQTELGLPQLGPPSPTESEI